MRLDRLLANQPSLSRRRVAVLLATGSVWLNGRVQCDGTCEVSRFDRVETSDGMIQAGARARYFMLNKPAGYVSATRDAEHPTVLDLLNEPDKTELHIAGRLDASSTGLLVLTNDGQWSRRLTQPGAGRGKVYRIETGRMIDPACVARFAEGIRFDYEDLTTRPALLEVLGPYCARLTLDEGRYHQIKRMFGRFRNPVTRLHREAMGDLHLDPALAPGTYRSLTAEEIASV